MKLSSRPIRARDFEGMTISFDTSYAGLTRRNFVIHPDVRSNARLGLVRIASRKPTLQHIGFIANKLSMEITPQAVRI